MDSGDSSKTDILKDKDTLEAATKSVDVDTGKKDVIVTDKEAKSQEPHEDMLEIANEIKDVKMDESVTEIEVKVAYLETATADVIAAGKEVKAQELHEDMLETRSEMKGDRTDEPVKETVAIVDKTDTTTSDIIATDKEVKAQEPHEAMLETPTEIKDDRTDETVKETVAIVDKMDTTTTDILATDKEVKAPEPLEEILETPTEMKGATMGEPVKEKVMAMADKMDIDEPSVKTEEEKTAQCRFAYHVDFYGNQRNGCQLAFEGNVNVKLNEKAISLDDLRYAAKRSFRSFQQKVDHCVILSYIDNTNNEIKHNFLHMDTVEETTAMYEDFRKLSKAKFLVMEKENDYSVDLACYDTVEEQPIYFGGAEIKIKQSMDKTVVFEGRSIVVLDIECLALFPVVDNELKEPYRLMFWLEEGENSVEKILHYHKESRIVFETTTKSFEMPVIENIVEQLHSLQPKSKNVLACKPLLRQWVSSNTRTFTNRTKTTFSTASTSLFPEIHQEYEASAKFRPPAQAHISTAQVHTSDRNRQPERLRENLEGISPLQEFTYELNEALKQVEASEDFKMQWIPVEADLNAIIDGGTVPETDHYSGGLDPDNVDHFIRALKDVSDQLKENQLPIAVSRIQATRQIFEATCIPEIRSFLYESDMDLLRKLYFRSLML